MTKKFNILITGASSGIGQALSIAYANPEVRLFLFGRSKSKLANIVKLCEEKGAEVFNFSIDIRERQSMKIALGNIVTLYNLDIVIAGAGVSSNSLGNNISTDDKIYDIFSTNLMGVLNTILPIIPYMIKNKSGSIAVIGSMAGLLGFSTSPAYSSSKMAINCFIDSMRSYLKPYGINISMILPGYVDTPMTRVNKFFMPMKISADKAALTIIRGISKHKRIIAFPLSLYFIVRLIKILPYQLIDYINSKLLK